MKRRFAGYKIEPLISRVYSIHYRVYVSTRKYWNYELTSDTAYAARQMDKICDVRGGR